MNETRPEFDCPDETFGEVPEKNSEEKERQEAVEKTVDAFIQMTNLDDTSASRMRIRTALQKVDIDKYRIEPVRDAAQKALDAFYGRETAPEVVEEIEDDSTPLSSFQYALMRGLLDGRPLYRGTVPAHIVAKRRAKSRIARKSRRANRKVVA